MKVLLLTTDAYGGYGGIALYNRDLIEALTQMPDVDRVVVVPRVMPLSPEKIPDKVHFVTGALGGKGRYAWAALKIARDGADIVICGHINLLPLAVLLNLCLRSPLVLVVYGIEAWKRRSALVRVMLRGLDAVWSISVTTRDRMNGWARLPVARYTILPNAVRIDRVGAVGKSKEMIERLGVQGSPVILTLCRLAGRERRKGIDEVLDVMPILRRSMPNLKYVVAGEGDDRPRLEAKVRSLGLQGAVTFTGMVPETEKADIFRMADAFVMPSDGEGFGFVFLEAMACGTPVVGSWTDGGREALRDGLLGELVDPTQADSLVGAIRRALSKQRQVPEGLAYFSLGAFRGRVAEAVRRVAGSSLETPRAQ